MGFARFRNPSSAKRRRAAGETPIAGPSDLGLVSGLVSTDGAGDAVVVEPRTELLVYGPRSEQDAGPLRLGDIAPMLTPSVAATLSKAPGFASSRRSGGPMPGYQTHPDRDADVALRSTLATLGAFGSGHPTGTGDLEPPGGAPLVVLESHSLPQKTTPPPPPRKGTPLFTGTLPPELVLDLEAIIKGLKGARLRLCPICERPFLVHRAALNQKRCSTSCGNAEERAAYRAEGDARRAHEREKKRRQRAAKKKKKPKSQP